MKPSYLPYGSVRSRSYHLPYFYETSNYLSIGLEHESQALSRRMSAASIGSAQDDHVFDTFASNAAYHSRDRTATPTLQNPKPSSIPRPSLSHSRTTESPPNGSGASPQPESMKRTRTFSQPFPFDSSLTNGALNSPSGMASRSTSPMSITVKSTRIPVSRTRTGSTSSHKQPSLNGVLAHGRSDSRNGLYRGNGHAFQSPPEPMPDLYSLNEGQYSTVSSRSTMKTPRLNGPELSNEPAPFPTSASQVGYDQDFAPARMSSDSEERPFEHWYRGDVSRNGGVGELRIARKQEMLDIANYGHALRHESSRNAVGTSSRSRSNSRGHESPYARGNHRPRSGSLGVPGRASIYIDQDAMPDASMVFDEQPLTDLDSDEEAYNQEDEEYIEEDTTARFDEQSQRGISQLPADRSDTPTTLVDVSKSSIFKSRIPPPSSRQTSESPGMKKSTSNGTNGSPLPSKGTSKSISQASSPAATPKASPAGAKSTATKRRAKSPAAASTAGKKARTKPPAKPTKSRENEDRRSIAQYPSPEGDDIVHAIPTWTQPISGSGNWDDVSVRPTFVVAVTKPV